jgi:uncharacterized protein with ParB-like and HNH nuclease domain
MKITIESDLATSSSHFFAWKPKKFNNQIQPTEYIKIPLAQRDYDWGKFTTDQQENSIDGILEDLRYHINQTNEKYFAGTILLENQNDNYLKVIDGQQRITTLFLLNFIGYVLSKYRVENITGIHNLLATGFQFKKRFDQFEMFEKRIAINEFKSDAEQLMQDDNRKNFLERIGSTKNSDKQYWGKVKLRLQFDDDIINTRLIDTFKKSKIVIQNPEFKIDSPKNEYSEGLNIIINHLINHYYDVQKELDENLFIILEKIEKYLEICGLSAIISEEADDSFRLFEILNDRGKDLSALDLIKNIILERYHNENQATTNFSNQWQKLKENVNDAFKKGSADSIFVENIIKAEGVTTKFKEISYLTNKLADHNNKNIRSQLFIDEKVDCFFQRLIISAQILKELNKNTGIDPSSSPYNRNAMSTFQFATFMKMINYNWGPQVILSSNILYLKNSDYNDGFNSGTRPDWKNHHSKNDDLNHFLRFLSDITLKVGIIGIVNNLATDELPEASRNVVQLIIKNVQDNPNDFTQQNRLIELKRNIINALEQKIFTKQNFDLFETKLSDTFVANTNPKKNLVKIILYFLYNKGGNNFKFNLPELEHLEASKPISGTSPYYSENDRDEIINRLGNFALIEKDINIKQFSNKPLIKKIDLFTSDPNLTNIAIFRNDLFLNLNYNNSLTKSAIYGDMPSIKKAISNNASSDDSFDINGVPTKYFFTERSKFLATKSREIICNSKSFLFGGDKY